ncbi:ATP-dependent DNA ligase [Bacillus cereus]|uniref:ATP-dependent DNA ligase n=1 Tax=Bacillus cereus TaxID=1396 RepID=UPI00032E7347|nr:hypothetical protein [Bacillus cereus]EOO44158.1 hypothetical protein ICK_06415 [Bacillus cereus BAG1X2-2]EOP00443.1 hypothetical protein ICO_06399 [Bacillus cereus BAG2O-1]
MLEVVSILNEIGSTTKKKEKEEILSRNRGNQLLRDILFFIYNPYIKTNIAQKKLSKKVKKDAITFYPTNLSVYDFMKRLEEGSGKDDDIAFAQYFIENSPEECRWLLEAMAIKNLKIGITGVTINKAFEETFIPQFDIMLADKWIDVLNKTNSKTGEKTTKIIENWKLFIGKRVIATRKLDGNRCVVFNKEDGVKIYSREGHPMIGFIEIEEAFKQFPVGQVYDGELLAINEEGLNSHDLYKKTSKIVKRKGEKVGLEFHGFDVLPIEKFNEGGFEIECEKRKLVLKTLIEREKHPLVKNVDILYVGEFDKELLEELAEREKENGEEGIMVQLAEAPYECKRTKKILKVKAFESADIRCIDIYEGKEASTKNKLGGLVLDFKGFPVNVGGGYSQLEREEYWKNPKLVLGKIIEIKYFEEFVEEDGSLDLRFATFKTVREDKTEPSYY